jgi:hypothetical protein
MTEDPIAGPGNAVWDDGEWISWNYINQRVQGPEPEGSLVEDLIVVAKDYFEETGRHLPIYGELGELYAARRFEIELHRDPKAQGSDGRCGNVFVEIKTISPLRDSRHVRVKKCGNFGWLVIVKIDADFRIDAKVIKRSKLGKPEGDHFVVRWEDHQSDHEEFALAGALHPRKVCSIYYTL